MPVRKVRGGYKVQGTKSKPMTKKAATRQQAAIKIAQAKRGKRR